ncbi:putative DnaJ domain-containing protein [Lupinus albus]|uniref:Putative DnaJ domain-containing protein n=1 Tax=Lupinus albus TaxID=3870 RepID=A0A6A4R1G6_LUPAL|nr:putative DnaJ domain-containing protein [Lupinus albus]
MNMDHYKVLGLHRTASKEEIKTAFKKLAFQFHPDKHSQSSKSIRDAATLRFKQVSEAYEVLMDDRKRADYNFRFRSGAGATGYGGAGGGGYYSSYGYGYGRSGGGYESSRYKSSTTSGFNGGGGFASRFEIAMRILTARSSLLSLGFAAAILGSIVVINTSGESLWNMQNSGKSFEEAMKSIEKAKAYREENMKERP